MLLCQIYLFLHIFPYFTFHLLYHHCFKAVVAPENFSWGVLRGQNAYLRGKFFFEMPKIADFSHFFPSDWGKVGGRASNWGENSPCPPWCRHWFKRHFWDCTLPVVKPWPTCTYIIQANIKKLLSLCLRVVEWVALIRFLFGVCHY